jgi:hypothetical protein
MEKKEIIARLKASPHWSSQYNNYQAFADGADKELADMGLCSVQRIWELYTPSDIIEKRKTHTIMGGHINKDVVISFEKHEPDYGKYQIDWQAKEAQPYYSPEYGYIARLSDVNEWKKEDANFRKQAYERQNVEDAKERLNKKYTHCGDKYPTIYAFAEALIGERDNEATYDYLRQRLQSTPNGRKYKATYNDQKYLSLQDAEIQLQADITERKNYYSKQILRVQTEIKKYEEIIKKGQVSY